jgi:RIO kinase 1
MWCFCLFADIFVQLPQQQHKLAVKEAKREKRKDKMPKHVKKKIMSSTSRRKK